jgi:HAD superfamily hydrolase (TIGR01458 family)
VRSPAPQRWSWSCGARASRFASSPTSPAAPAARLADYGIALERERIFTAVVAGALWLSARGVRRIAPFVAPETLEDLEGFELAGGVLSTPPVSEPDAVVVGDLGDRWSHRLLNEAFRYVRGGAHLLALQRGRYWLGPTGLEVDAGAYVAALEYATGVEAIVCGKPNPEFFRSALASFGNAVPPDGGRSVAMVGDDLWSDIEGAQAAGLQGWLVRTGKYRVEDLERSGIRPDRVIDSVADLGTSGA